MVSMAITLYSLLVFVMIYGPYHKNYDGELNKKNIFFYRYEVKMF